jgi:predicted DNA-binding transcriptional regulator YafY
MQEFLTNNTVSCNLMSLTGYRTLVILNALIESPLSNEEINECLLNDQYIQEKFSNDTLRLYINSLREIGCEIIGANKSNNKKYELVSHPFTYEISKSQLKAISKLYKSIYDKIDIKEVIIIENFFEKISNLAQNEDAKEALRSISVLKGIKGDILNDLLLHCKNKNQIVFKYNSPRSGEKQIEIIADKISFKSGKLYLWGNNLTYKQYSYFAVERVLEICNIKLLKNEAEFSSIKVTYELYNNNDYVPLSSEKIIEKSENKLTIEADSENEFSLMQRLLYFADDCKILQPQEFKDKLLAKLKSMEESYENV